MRRKSDLEGRDDAIMLSHKKITRLSGRVIVAS